MREPQEIEDEDHEQVLERVAAVDVAKASGMVCTRVPHESKVGRRVTKVWQVDATTNAIIELAEHLAGLGVERVTVESTSDYWRPFVYLLEARGLRVQLVNAHQAKHVPGRPKTDRLDAVWLARLTERGMLRPSFVPPAQIRQLRDYTRLRVDLTHERTRYWQRLEQAAGRRPDQGVQCGEHAGDGLNPGHARRADCRRTQPEGAGRPGAWANEGQARRPGRGAHRPVRRPPRRAGPHAAGPDRRAHRPDRHAHRPHRAAAWGDPAAQGVDADGTTGPGAGSGPAAAVLPAAARLDEVTGIGPGAAQAVTAEVGLDMGVFSSPGQLVSWARLCPPTIQSGAKTRAGATGKGNPYLRGVLGEAAVAAAKTDTFLGERYRRLVKRRGKLKALVAVARSILVIVWHLLADPAARYHDLGAGYYTDHIDKAKKARNHIRQMGTRGCAAVRGGDRSVFAVSGRL